MSIYDDLKASLSVQIRKDTMTKLSKSNDPSLSKLTELSAEMQEQRKETTSLFKDIVIMRNDFMVQLYDMIMFSYYANEIIRFEKPLKYLFDILEYTNDSSLSYISEYVSSLAMSYLSSNGITTSVGNNNTSDMIDYLDDLLRTFNPISSIYQYSVIDEEEDSFPAAIKEFNQSIEIIRDLLIEILSGSDNQEEIRTKVMNIDRELSIINDSDGIKYIITNMIDTIVKDIIVVNMKSYSYQSEQKEEYLIGEYDMFGDLILESISDMMDIIPSINIEGEVLSGTNVFVDYFQELFTLIEKSYDTIIELLLSINQFNDLIEEYAPIIKLPNINVDIDRILSLIEIDIVDNKDMDDIEGIVPYLKRDGDDIISFKDVDGYYFDGFFKWSSDPDGFTKVVEESPVKRVYYYLLERTEDIFSLYPSIKRNDIEKIVYDSKLEILIGSLKKSVIRNMDRNITPEYLAFKRQEKDLKLDYNLTVRLNPGKGLIDSNFLSVLPGLSFLNNMYLAFEKKSFMVKNKVQNTDEYKNLEFKLISLILQSNNIDHTLVDLIDTIMLDGFDTLKDMSFQLILGELLYKLFIKLETLSNGSDIEGSLLDELESETVSRIEDFKINYNSLNGLRDSILLRINKYLDVYNFINKASKLQQFAIPGSPLHRFLTKPISIEEPDVDLGVDDQGSPIVEKIPIIPPVEKPRPPIQNSGGGISSSNNTFKALASMDEFSLLM